MIVLTLQEIVKDPDESELEEYACSSMITIRIIGILSVLLVCHR